MANINIVNPEDLRRMRGEEGLIIQGCGGDINEWVDGINEILTNEGILLDESNFSEVTAFKHESLTNLLFKFSDNIKLNIGKLAIWRLASHETFGGTWLTDYVDNNLGGFEMSDFEKEIHRLNSFADTETSFEFQCDETGGLPTCLMWNKAEGKAWLAPNDSIDSNYKYYDTAVKACEKFGIQNCNSIKEFNSILDNLGEDAKHCKIYEETEDLNM